MAVTCPEKVNFQLFLVCFPPFVLYKSAFLLFGRAASRRANETFHGHRFCRVSKFGLKLSGRNVSCTCLRMKEWGKGIFFWEG